ncbi:uncharacterized protein LOC122034726 [Zingiber officinale]|uniref:uncharacterized protein LOC122034726 n=1 Tax=Zingiber officinale TaxID=94328 RepID=UPI001C4D9F4D|nr:uncharacterized protein LOC122034726 [Zingiber officinale]
MPPRKKSAGEGTSKSDKSKSKVPTSSRPQPSSSGRFPNQQFEKNFKDRTFKLLPCRSVDKKYMNEFCPSITETIAYYKLDTLVYLERDINLDLVSEFYNNLHQTLDGNYRTRVAKQNVDFNMIDFLGYLACRVSTGLLSFYPDLPDPVPPPLDASPDSIYEYFFGHPRQDGLNELDDDFPTFPALSLSPPDYILFKVVTQCLLPITTKSLAEIRPYHCLMLYGLRRRLDFDIMSNIYASIVFHSTPSGDNVYMPYGHVITDWLETLGIDVSKGRLVKMVRQDCRLGKRAFSKSGILSQDGTIRWMDGRALGELPLPRQGARAPAPAALVEADPDLRWQIAELEDRFDRHEEMVAAEFVGLRLHIDRRFETLQRHQLATHQAFMGWMASHPPPQPSTDDPSSGSGVPPQGFSYPVADDTAPHDEDAS